MHLVVRNFEENRGLNLNYADVGDHSNVLNQRSCCSVRFEYFLKLCSDTFFRTQYKFTFIKDVK